MNTTDIKIAVDAELRRINVPELAFHSDHEGWAVLLEEVEETKEEVVELEDATEVLKKLIFSDDCDPGDKLPPTSKKGNCWKKK